jgi:protocatechuate 3,4-dioxygenase beta subunit
MVKPPHPVILCNRFRDSQNDGYFLLFFFLSFFLSFSAIADPAIIGPSLSPNCALTPTIGQAEDVYPGKGKVEKSNKLIRPAGKAVYAEGERLFFMGKILDERCMPVEGAHIELWQTDPHGRFKWATKGELMSPSATFAGSGTAITNNLGEFQFDTVFPGPYESHAPHLNVRITHPDLVPLTTRIYFRNDRRNIADPQLMALSPDLRQRLMGVMNAQEISSYTSQALRSYIELVLRGKEKFSTY